LQTKKAEWTSGEPRGRHMRRISGSSSSTVTLVRFLSLAMFEFIHVTRAKILLFLIAPAPPISEAHMDR
jgi:hypothetical protein